MSQLPLTGVDAGEEAAFVAAVMRNFHEDAPDDGALRPWAERMDRDRALTVRDGDDIVANFLVDPGDVSLPGGGQLPCAAVTAVGVAQTHRRRGLLRRMMDAALDRAVAEGEPVAALYATESAIYPRFGFDVSAPLEALRAAADRVRFVDPVDDRLVQAASPEAAIATAETVYEQVRSARPGGVARDRAAWELALLEDPVSWREGATARRLVHVPGRGYAAYRVRARYRDDDDTPDAEVRVQELVAADAEAEQALWQHVLSVDLARTTVAWPRPTDDALRWQVIDPLPLRIRSASSLYTRLLDVPVCLGARAVAVEGGVTLEVVDHDRDAGGRFRWEAGPDGASCVPTDRPADVRCSVRELSVLWLGGTSARTLARARRLDEDRPGGIERLDALTAWPLAPWTPWEF